MARAVASEKVFGAILAIYPATNLLDTIFACLDVYMIDVDACVQDGDSDSICITTRQLIQRFKVGDFT